MLSGTAGEVGSHSEAAIVVVGAELSGTAGEVGSQSEAATVVVGAAAGEIGSQSEAATVVVGTESSPEFFGKATVAKVVRMGVEMVKTEVASSAR